MLPYNNGTEVLDGRINAVVPHPDDPDPAASPYVVTLECDTLAGTLRVRLTPEQLAAHVANCAAALAAMVD